MSMSLQNSHRCIERNTECDCPICGEYLFTSPETVVFMPCGHSIHQRCYNQHIKSYTARSYRVLTFADRIVVLHVLEPSSIWTTTFDCWMWKSEDSPCRLHMILGKLLYYGELSVHSSLKLLVTTVPQRVEFPSISLGTNATCTSLVTRPIPNSHKLL